VLADDVFASSAHLRLLADGEQRLVDVVNNYVTAERRRLKQVEQLVFIYWVKITELVFMFVYQYHENVQIALESGHVGLNTSTAN